MLDVLDNFYRVFKRQNYEDEFFDVIFNVDGREIYAHRAILASVSPVFKEQLIQNRSTPNHSIQIDGYSYDEFFEFIDDIYDINEKINFFESDHIDAVIELSHIYKVDAIKEGCAKYLVDELPIYNAEYFFKAMEAVYKCTFLKFNEEIEKYIRENVDDLIGYTGFLNLDKSVIQAFVIFARNVDDQEELCEAVYKWGKHQAMITENMIEEEKNDLILHYIKDILPSFTLNSLIEFFVNQNGLISVNDAKKVKTIQVSVTSNDKSISGSFVDSYGIFEHITSHENEMLSYSFTVNTRFFWWKYFDIPSTSSVIEKREGIEWYLLFAKNGYLYIKHQSIIEENDYLIAEMKASKGNVTGDDGNGFMINQGDDVFATVSRKYEQIFSMS